VVVEVTKQRGEWCEPGATILKIAQMKLLRVEGTVNAANFNVHDVTNKPVTVQVNLAGNAVEQFKGKVVYVDPRIQVGGEYRVVAEVQNRKDRTDSYYLLRPGSEAEMVIDLRGGLAQDRLPPAQNATPVQTVRR
jgi:hypothetical protein